MNRRLINACGVAALGMAGAMLALAPASAQAPAGIAKPWTMPRTLDGQPDLQGSWTNATLTPLERPGDNTPLVLSAEDVARREKAFSDRVDRLAQDSDPNRPAPPKGGDGSTGAAGMVGGYNNFWIDPGDSVARVNGEYRSSLIVDPPNGKVPALTAEARQRGQARLALMKGRGQYDHPEFRPLAERCLMSFGSNAGPPMLPNYFYNNNYQIVQTKDHIMILVEMVHDVRIIRMGGERLSKSVRPWMGDSIGRWEGDTLVVETTNFHPLQQFRGASDTLKVIERFHRVDADTILYKFTIDDPTTFASAWSGEVPFRRTDELIYEYACHEGNYALSNVLSGERDRERREAERKKTQQ
ncbi:MAG: hypothetical protein ACT4QD_11275 [Acidobacteriota bacterium]